jgi:hypothetical protein
MIVLLFALLAGCSAGGKQFSGLEKPATASAQVYVYRPSALLQSGIFPDIEIDSKLVGKLKNGGYLRFQVEPGEHKLSVTGNYLQWNHATREFDVSYEAGKTYFYQLQPFVASGGGMVGGVYLANHSYSFMLVENEDDAVAELQKLKESVDAKK